jgi:outer membrane biosynthesis protein TonB
VDLTGEVKWLEYFDPFTGEYIPVEIKDGVMEETFRAGEGRVYRLRTDEPPVETEAPTEAPTEEPTEVPTEAPTETPTEIPTEEPTEAPTETPTEAPKGCGSSLTASLLLPVLTAAAAVGALRKGRKKERT